MKSSQDNTISSPKAKLNLKSFLAKFGIYGFVFFLVKGLVWIAIAVLTYYFGEDFFNNIF